MICGGQGYLGLTREVGEAAGLVVGDAVDVVLERDEEPRVVEVPDALAAALAGDDAARAVFEARPQPPPRVRPLDRRGQAR